jgi:hypothetical protein
MYAGIIRSAVHTTFRRGVTIALVHSVFKPDKACLRGVEKMRPVTPEIKGSDDAIWNRLHLIPFTVTIPKEKIDRALPGKLLAEAEGILAWAVKGARLWLEHGLAKPPEVEAFKEDVTSAPNTKISLRTQDEETAKFFIRASAEHTVMKRTVSLRRGQLFGWERFEKGATGSEREEREYRAEDEHIKNLPKGQMQILMTDDTEGTLHRHLHVRPPENVGLSSLDAVLAPRLSPVAG